MQSRFKFRLPAAAPVRRQRPAVGIANRGLSLAGRHVPDSDVDLVREEKEKQDQLQIDEQFQKLLDTKFKDIKLSDDHLRKIRSVVTRQYYAAVSEKLAKQLKGVSKSGATLQHYRRSEEDQIFGGKNHGPDDAVGSHDPNSDDGELNKVFQTFGVSAADYSDPNGRPGISFGVISGYRPFASRRMTRQNEWIFNPICLRKFLKGITNNRQRGRDAAERAAIVLYWFYRLGQEDSFIWERNRTIFNTIVEVSSLRKRLFNEGVQMFVKLPAQAGAAPKSIRDMHSIPEHIMQKIRDYYIGDSVVDEEERLKAPKSEYAAKQVQKSPQSVENKEEVIDMILHTGSVRGSSDAGRLLPLASFYFHNFIGGKINIPVMQESR
jgi:hypothetical protein